MADTPKRKLPPVPEYHLDSYEPVSITRPVYVVTDEILEDRIKAIMEGASKDYLPTKRQVAGPKDTIEISIHVDKDGEEVKGLCSDKQVYSLGQGYMPIGFDRNVVGMKVGESKSFDFDAPDFDDPDAKERSFHAEVAVLAVLKEAEPELTDEWVSKHIMLCKDVETFRNRTRKQLEQEAAKAAEGELMDRAVRELATRFKGSIDDVWYESTRDDLLRTYEEQAKAQGTDLDGLLAAQGMDKQQFNMMLMLQVREMLVQGFVLDAWARHYGLEATEDDVLYVANLMSNNRGKLMLDNLREAGEEEQLKGLEMAARRYVANKDLLEKAHITEE